MTKTTAEEAKRTSAQENFNSDSAQQSYILKLAQFLKWTFKTVHLQRKRENAEREHCVDRWMTGRRSDATQGNREEVIWDALFHYVKHCPHLEL